jgi:hypothetical protein
MFIHEGNANELVAVQATEIIFAGEYPSRPHPHADVKPAGGLYIST